MISRTANMEEPTKTSHIVEIARDLPIVGAPVKSDLNTACIGARCGFSDADSRTKQAVEHSRAMKKLSLAMLLCILFMVGEVVGGIKANSLAILTDAAHLLSDVVAFGISLFSLWASSWEATPRRSYGFFRVEILGTLVSIQLIWLITGILVYEAVIRIIHGNKEVHGLLMFIIAGCGLLVNLSMAFLLGHAHHGHGHVHGHDHGHSHGHGHDHGHSHDHDEEEHNHHDHHEKDHDHHHHHHHHEKDIDHKHSESKSGDDADDETKKSKNMQKKKRNINVQSAYLHVLGDSIQSIGVMLGGGLIWWKPEWKVIDLICTLFFSMIVLTTTIRMLRSILDVLMESTPREIDAGRLERGLCDMEEVVAVHELHVWAITVGKILLSCHVKIKPEADADLVLNNVIAYLQKEYSITHVTIQIER